MANVTRCDGCGVERPDDGTGWYRILAPLVGPADWMTSLVARAHWDLCSWKCAADLATLKALDPTPPAT